MNSEHNGIIRMRLVQQIYHLLRLDWNVRICHICRESNTYADVIVNMSYGLDLNLMLYEHSLLKFHLI